MDAILTALSFVAMGIGGLSLVSAVSLAFVLAWDKAAAEFKEFRADRRAALEFKASQSRAQRVLDAHFRQALEVANSGRAGREQAALDAEFVHQASKTKTFHNHAGAAAHRGFGGRPFAVLLFRRRAHAQCAGRVAEHYLIAFAAAGS